MNNKFLIHIAEPSKFLDSALNLFEEIAPTKNIVFLAKRDEKFEVLAVDESKIFFKAENKKKYDHNLSQYLSQCVGVIIHHLSNDYKYDLVLTLPINIPIVWISWGPDLTTVPNLYKKLYAPITYRYTLNKYFYLKYPIYFVRDFLYKFDTLRNILFSLGWRKNINKALKAIERTNYVATVIPNEFSLLKENVKYSGKYIQWNYCSHLELLSDAIINGNNILVGHSSHPINNQLDCFYLIEKLKIQQNILIPCSYGDMNYRTQLIATGTKFFGEKLIIAPDFLSFEEYAQLLLTCSSAIMGQYCQQGTGTAVILLWQGTKVFLSEQNPMYSFYKKSNIHVFSIETDLGIEPTDKPLNKTQIQNNRSALRKLYGREQLIENTLSLYNTLTSNTH